MNTSPELVSLEDYLRAIPKNIHNPAKDTPGTIDAQGNIKITWVSDGGWVVGYECLSERLGGLGERVVPSIVHRDLLEALKRMYDWLIKNDIRFIPD